MGCIHSNIDSLILDMFNAEESNDGDMLHRAIMEFDNVYNPLVDNINMYHFHHYCGKHGWRRYETRREFVICSMMVNAVFCGRSNSVNLLRSKYPFTLKEITSDFISDVFESGKYNEHIINELLADPRVPAGNKKQL